MNLVSKASSKSFFTKSVDAFHRLNIHYDGTINIFSTFAMAALNDSYKSRNTKATGCSKVCSGHDKGGYGS